MEDHGKTTRTPANARDRQVFSFPTNHFKGNSSLFWGSYNILTSKTLNFWDREVKDQYPYLNTQRGNGDRNEHPFVMDRYGNRIMAQAKCKGDHTRTLQSAFQAAVAGSLSLCGICSVGFKCKHSQTS